jgi:HD-GYP domain-containing protein (c-di-GMP phosphodiesterase class II)/DNA-binding CsgD family transcriptional regulator
VFRLLGLLGGLSAVTDLGTGAVLDEALTRCVVATRFARALGCAPDEVADVLYTALLQHVGCTAYAYETGRVWGDDVAATRSALRTDFSSARDVLREWVPGMAAATGRSRARVLARTLATARSSAAAPVATCEVARAASRDLGLPDGVRRALGHVLASWDGSGVPPLSGDSIPRATRIVHVAAVAVGAAPGAGVPAALAQLGRRSGTALDPGLVTAFADAAGQVLDGLDEVDAYRAVLDAEPDPVRRVPDDTAVDVARTFGRLVDLKVPGTLGHAEAVAELAGRAALALGFDREAVADVRLAGHLHELGKVGVPSPVWARATAPSAIQREQARIHAYYGERIIGRVPELAGVARLVGEHHERLDGSGYHRGLTGPHLSLASRVLAAADAYRARVEGRPGAPPEPSAAAASWLRAEVTAGRLDPDAVEAVLEGPRTGSPAHRVRPSGLTPRQVQVLRLVARGLSNAQIARELVISRRTAEHHVQDVYAHAGVSTRAGAAMFALRHGLVEVPGPQDRSVPGDLAEA